jgi:ArsR family transcriptional regulator, nickel/cobalt-responsive transcriptional repressor
MKSPRTSADCATKLAVLADPTRLAVVEVLLAGSRNVTEINRRVPVAQNLLSHHLRVLREAEIVTSSRDGKGILYALAEGVELGSAHNAINLGCCSLKFTDIHTGKKP